MPLHAINSEPSATSSEHRVVGWSPSFVAAVATTVPVLLLHAWYFRHTCDDAYISFRYARNLVDGLGLVYNPGERVMGYSNFLWVLLLAGLHALGLDLVLAARILGALFSGATLLLTVSFVRQWSTRAVTAWFPAVWLALNGTFALWTLGGLEGPLFAFLLLGAVVSASRLTSTSSPRAFAKLGLWLGLAALTRPEGVFYSVPICTWVLFRRFFTRKRSNPEEKVESRRLLAGVALALSIDAAFYLALSLWMFFYYGDPLPNTYYAKAHPLSPAILSRGMLFAWRFLRAYHFVPAGILFWWAVATRLSPRARGWLPSSVIGAFLVFFLVTGGDALVYHRMWFWTLPMFGLLAAEAAEATCGRRPVLAWTAGAAALALTFPNSIVGEDITYLRADDRFLADVAVLGRYLREETSPDTLIAANNIGVLGYESQRPILDMLGLTDRHIARAPGKPVATPGHESHDGGYVLQRDPDLVFLGMPRVLSRPATLRDKPGRLYPSDVDLIRDARFRARYALYNFELPGGRYAPVFLKKTLFP